MLHILTGRAGSGKTKEIFRRMAAAGANRPQLLLVPEQASFETEQRLCRENGNRAGLYSEVLTFTRLENRVLSLAGGGARGVLDEGGRLLVMYAALRSVASNLKVYAMHTRKPEFLNSLIATADELKSCCVTGEALLRAGEETEGLDGDKLRDLGLIFGAYEAMTARGSLDPRDRLTRLADKLRDCPYCEGKDVWLDGFTDFTPQQGLVLERILRQAASVTVSLTMEPGRGEEEVFAPARRTAAWLKRLAGQAASPVTEEHIPTCARGRTKPLRHLEANLFALPMEPYDGPLESCVTVAALPSPRDEVSWAAGIIRDLVREGYRYRDIVLTARSMERYRDDIREIFAAFDLPVFQAEKTDILQKPIFTLITAALDAVNGGYDYEDMFRYLKTGLAGLTFDQCDRLENYVRTWDLWGSRWTAKKDWTMHPAGYSRAFSEEDRELLAELNALRRQVVEPLETLRQTSGDTIRSQGMALYAFLESIGAPDALEARAASLLEEGEPELSREYSQLWEIFCGALEQCVALLGDMEADFSEFSRLLKLLLSRYTVGTIPASLDRITAGDAPRLSNRSSKVLLLLGADDGAIPQVTPGQGLLTDRDRELLEGFGLELSARVEERLSRENTIVYTACTQPTDRLYVSWPTAGETRPSFLVERLSYLFPQCVVQPEPPLAPDRLITLAAEVPEARAALEKTYGEAFSRLDRAAGWSRGKLSPRAVRRLYGEKVAMSASRMDKYKSCHFAYFLQYGLAAKPRRRAGFDAPEYGTFVHYVLEHVLKAAKVRGGVPSCSDEEIRGLTRQAVSEYVHTQLGGMEHQTPRFKYLFRRLQAGVQAVVDNVVDELRASDFQPILFELGFGSGQDLPPVEVKSNGITLRISGFVDRVDGWEKDGRLYVRVVDYKTGRKSFDLTEVWNGLGLQMLLYLFTLEERGEALLGTQPTPAGVLYLPARDALVSGSRAMEATQRQALLDKELVRRGLVLDDEEVIQAMEHGEGGMRFLPLKVSARTGAISGDALVTAEKLGRLRRHTRHILEDICKEIAAGNIDADPFWRGPAKNACQYCDYVQVCQFEEDRDRRRWIPTVRSGAFWESLEEEGGENHGRTADP